MLDRALPLVQTHELLLLKDEGVDLVLELALSAAQPLKLRRVLSIYHSVKHLHPRTQDTRYNVQPPRHTAKQKQHHLLRHGSLQLGLYLAQLRPRLFNRRHFLVHQLLQLRGSRRAPCKFLDPGVIDRLC